MHSMSKMWLGATVTQVGLSVSAKTRKSLLVSCIPLLSTRPISPLKSMQVAHVNPPANILNASEERRVVTLGA